MDSKEIGLQLLTSWVVPPLWIGITLTSFNKSGCSPVSKEMLMMHTVKVPVCDH